MEAIVLMKQLDEHTTLIMNSFNEISKLYSQINMFYLKMNIIESINGIIMNVRVTFLLKKIKIKLIKLENK